MKTKIQLLLLLVCLVLVSSCEADFDNSIPEGQADITKSHQKLKQILLSKEKEGNIWVTTPMKFKKEYRYMFGRWKNGDIVTPYFVGYDFKDDGGVKIYATIRQADFQTKSNQKDILHDNPNTYEVRGELRSELAILSKGVLSQFKREKLMDFDYRVEQFEENKIDLATFYSKVITPKFSLIPYNAEKFFSFAKVCEYLYDEDGTYSTVIESSRAPYKIFIENEKGAQELVSFPNRNPNSYATVISEIIHQNYDADKELLGFKITDDIKKIEKGLKFFASKLVTYKIKYLEVENFAPDKIVLKSYDSPSDKTDTDKVYKIIIEY
ncbi:hypothetical protein [Polaribacter cellanae]|uniref:DUF4302 domain-containing protein n=1 Tax=Polaribacter cellanae TaxID=2818493 RepID=A0A975CNP6_9FLAO|nr:hypothetical protein [Polaribacter cellanae]QTE22570.1 hypothetical protein J3359_17525 [Polaribacter cellanae]